MNSLSTEAILALLNPDQQKELFYALQLIVPPEENDIKTKLSELEEKYFDLVWFARSRPENHHIPDVKAAFDKVKAKYPEEIAKIQDPDMGDWQHGFNSGMLACTRLLRAYALPHKHREVIEEGGGDDSSDEDDGFVLTRQSEIEQAQEDFPHLDT